MQSLMVALTKAFQQKALSHWQGKPVSVVGMAILLPFLCFSCSQPSTSERPEPVLAKQQPVEPLTMARPATDPQLPASGTSLLIKNATIMTAAGKIIDQGYVTVEDGVITQVAVGQAPDDLKADDVIDASGKFLTPGLIDTHSHIGVYPMPSANAHGDGNEATKPSRADVWAEHSFWPQDPAIWRAVAGGVTSMQVLPGSANLIGGRSITVKLRPGAVDVQQLKFAGAPQGLKMACGENPKRVYADKGGPSTRMGNIAGFRQYFQKAFEYQRKWEIYQRDLDHWQHGFEETKTMNADKQEKRRKALGDAPQAPGRDHTLDTLVKAMKGEILVHIHCYRADEMAIMLDLAEIYGFKIRSFHHALEAYKIAERLANREVSVSTWADWWGFKMEAFDGIPQNAGLVHAAGGRTIIHSDSAEDIRFLNLEAAKARASAERIGMVVSDDEVLRWITYNPAWALGVEDKVGSIEVGKQADLVLWDAHPLSSYARTSEVFIDGKLVFDRDRELFYKSDFEFGLRPFGLGDGREGDTSSIPADLPQQPINGERIETSPEHFILANAWLELGDGSHIAKGFIEIKRGQIVRVGAGEPPASDAISRIDAGGRVVTPGLIESQAQLGLVLVEMEESSRDDHADRSMTPAFDARDGYDPYSIRLAIAREGGITTAIIKPRGGTIAGQGMPVDLRNVPQSSQILIDQQILFARVRGGDSNRGEFWLRLRQAFDDAAFYDRLKQPRNNPIAFQLSLSPIHLQVLSRVLEGAIPIVLEAHRLSDIQAAIRFKNEMRQAGHSIDLILSGASEAWLARKELVASGVGVLLTPTKQMPSDFDRLRARDDAAALLQQADVAVILSTDDLNVRRLRQQAAWAVAHGLDYRHAIAAVTHRPAEVFGLKDRGLIATGKRADLVLWSHDPLQVEATADAVWIAGELQDLETRQLELAKRYKKPAASH